jgi:BON domain
MSIDPKRQRKNRPVNERSSRSRASSRRSSARLTGEAVVASTVIAAAALATFLALFVTSRPYDPMSSSTAPQQDVPQGLALPQPSLKPSATATPIPQSSQSPQSVSEPTREASKAIPDDAAIEAQIEKSLASDSTLSQLDVSTLVENGKVTLVGSVRSADQKLGVERVVRAIKGVLAVDNQLVVTAATP